MMKNLRKEQKANKLEEQDLIPVSKWNEHFAYPSVGAIRQLIFYNTNNFNNHVIRKLGNRLYIKVSAFNEWVENNKEIA